MAKIHKIAPCLWFDDQAQEAAEYYVSIFPGSRITNITYYREVGQDCHGRPPGSVMVVAFELHGYGFTALNGGPVFTFNEAISLQVACDTAEEIDYYWGRLTAGGDEAAQHCGWLKDRYGLSWQVVPRALPAMLGDPDPARSQRVMEAMMAMTKIDPEVLQQAYDG